MILWRSTRVGFNEAGQNDVDSFKEHFLLKLKFAVKNFHRSIKF